MSNIHNFSLQTMKTIRNKEKLAHYEHDKQETQKSGNSVIN